MNIFLKESYRIFAGNR